MAGFVTVAKETQWLIEFISLRLSGLTLCVCWRQGATGSGRSEVLRVSLPKSTGLRQSAVYDVTLLIMSVVKQSLNF